MRTEVPGGVSENSFPGEFGLFRLRGLLKQPRGLSNSVSLFKEPPFFTAVPESRIVAEVEDTVDMACEALGE